MVTDNGPINIPVLQAHGRLEKALSSLREGSGIAIWMRGDEVKRKMRNVGYQETKDQ